MTNKLLRLRLQHFKRLNNDLITFKMYGRAFFRATTEKEKADIVKRMRDLGKNLIKRSERVERLNFAIDNELESTDFNDVDEMLFQVKHPDQMTPLVNSILAKLI